MRRSPIASAVLFAGVAAVAFGSTTPFIRRFGTGTGPLATACLLYLGAALSSIARRPRSSAEARVRPSDGPRLVAVTLAGAVVAPVALAWGLQRADATGAALLLNGEAVFTALLARLLFRESLGARVGIALAIMAAAGAIMVGAAARVEPGSTAGYLAIVLATMAWATDSALSRPLADRDPIAVVLLKSSLGALLTGALAASRREPPPSLGDALVLLVCGATGYGLSLRLYLLAQRRMGAARTASVFSIAPFAGALVAWAIGEGKMTAPTAAAGALFAIGVSLHLSERHAHEHTHAPLEHDHAHRHDDGHHEHVHDPPVAGSHSHVHGHDARTHSHEHAPDAHHGHRH